MTQPKLDYGALELGATAAKAIRDAAAGLAGSTALVAIMIVVVIALQRMLDVALVLAPLVLSTLLTVLLLQLNLASIIALPMLPGVRGSFNIYIVMNWRTGFIRPSSSAMVRAVLFSALTTATVFGSHGLSRHSGTASMGALLMLLSLGYTLLVTLLLFQHCWRRCC